MEMDEAVRSRIEQDEAARARKRLIWGAFLIALGGALMLDHMGVIQLPSLAHLWPAIFLVITVSHVAEGRFGSALTNLMLGAWFFACVLGWYGLTYSNSWPLALIAVGAGIVVRALGGERPSGLRERLRKRVRERVRDTLRDTLGEGDES